MVIGYIDFFIAQTHAKIKVLAFKRDNEWISDDNEIIEMFQPAGYVFEPSFTLNNEIYKEKELIIFEAGENTKAINENDDIFKIKGKVKNKLDYEVISAPKFINDEFSINYNYIQAKIEDLPNNFFLKNSAGYYGPFVKQNNLIRSYKGTTVSFYKNLENNIINYFGKSIVYDIPSESEIQIDFTSDDQLTIWFKKLLKTSSSIDNKNLNTLNEFLSNLSFEDDKVSKSRLVRIEKMFNSINLSFEELRILANSSQVLSSSLIDLVSNLKNEILLTEKSLLDQELNEYRHKIESEKTLIIKELQNLKKELANDSKSEKLEKIANDLNQKSLNTLVDFLNSQGKIIENKKSTQVDLEGQLLLYKKFGNAKNGDIKEAKKELEKILAEIEIAKNDFDVLNSKINHLTENREAVIRDIQLFFDITRPTSVIAPANQISKSYILEEILSGNSEHLSDADFEHNIVQNLQKRNKFTQLKFQELKSILSSFRCIFTSNLEVILSFIEATNNAIYTIIQIEPKWLSFKDLVDNGLEEIWLSAFDKPKVSHFVILRDMNLSSPECYANPLLDLDRNLRTRLPFIEKQWPSNLRIIGTIQPVPEVGLSILKSTFHNWGGLPHYDLQFTSANSLEYKEQALQVTNFNTWIHDRDVIKNYLEDYISE